MERARGQAGVELLAVLPALLLLAAVGLQLLLWALAAVRPEAAARAGARALARGDDGVAAARTRVPGALRGGAAVSLEGAALRVRLGVPALVPGAGGLAVEAVER